MRKMKESGLPWLGKVPYDWENETIRNLLTARDGGVWGDEVPEDEAGTICMRVADFDYGKGKFKECDEKILTKRKYPDMQVKRLRLEKGDILVEKSGGGEKTPVGRTVLFDKDYPALFANFMERLRFNVNVVIPEYVEYWLRAWYTCRCSPFYINQTTGIQNINLTLMLAKERIYYPSIVNQENITAFLDARCTEIDDLAADIQSQIDTLEQYKRSVITEAVTKGLNPAAEMRDSGIPWIGEIPANWKVMPNKYLMFKQKNICPVYGGEDILSLTMGGVIVRDLDAGGKMPATFDGYQRVEAGNLLMCLFDIDVTPCCVGLIKQDGLTSPAYSQFVLLPEADASYYCYYYTMLDNDKTLLHLAKNLRHSLTEDQLGAIFTVVPPISEQRCIAAFLDAKCAEIDSVIADKKQQIEIVNDYKKSLIFEYVTGKKEVPAP